MVEFGEQLRRAREAKGMTQQSLAEQLFVTRQSVSRWECGDRYPDLLTTTKLAQILEVSLDDLLSGKEMEKVVERNPVVENKTANNIMIALYAVVVLSMAVPALNALLKLPGSGGTNAGDYSTLIIPLISYALQIFAFTFGLVNAIRDRLSPKRMGAVIVAFFTAMCISMLVPFRSFIPPEAITWNLNSGYVLKLIALVCVRLVPGLTGAVAAYFFFMKNKNHAIWPVLITLASVFGIFITLLSQYTIFTHYNDLFDLSQTLKLILNIAIYVLIIYQTFTLANKRKKLIGNNASPAVSSAVPR